MLLNDCNIIELTHLLTPGIPSWNGSCGFCLEVKQGYDKLFCVQQIKTHAGIGTHIDAPSHRFQEGLSVGDIPLKHLILQAHVIDVSKKSHANYEISLEDIEEYETVYGQISEQSLVIGYTGWDRFWSAPETYRNVDEEGQMHFPAFSKEAAELLIQRNVAGIAIDTLSPDCLALDFPVHRLFLGQGKYIIENIAGCKHLPPFGAWVIALPLYAEKATEAPIRVIGLVKKD